MCGHYLSLLVSMGMTVQTECFFGGLSSVEMDSSFRGSGLGEEQSKVRAHWLFMIWVQGWDLGIWTSPEEAWIVKESLLSSFESSAKEDEERIRAKEPKRYLLKFFKINSFVISEWIQ